MVVVSCEGVYSRCQGRKRKLDALREICIYHELSCYVLNLSYHWYPSVRRFDTKKWRFTTHQRRAATVYYLQFWRACLGPREYRMLRRIVMDPRISIPVLNAALINSTSVFLYQVKSQAYAVYLTALGAGPYWTSWPPGSSVSPTHERPWLVSFPKQRQTQGQMKQTHSHLYSHWPQPSARTYS